LELTFNFNGHTESVVIGNSTEIFEDIIGRIFEISGGGPLRIDGSGVGVPQIWSRTYNVSPSGIGTYGQYIPAIRLDTQGNSEVTPTRYYLTGLQQGNGFRTNVGFVNLTSSDLVLNVHAYDEDGRVLGSATITTRPLILLQEGIASTQLIPAADGAGVITLRIDGARTGELLAYGSVVDQVSNDPVYIAGVPEVLMRDAGKAQQIIPGVGHLTNGSWRSDVAIFNPDGDPVTFDLEFFDSAGNKLSEALNYNLEAKHTLHLHDIVKSGVLIPVLESDALGVLRITTRSSITMSHPIVVDRTYSDQGASGTFGQGIFATTAAEANVSVGSPAIIAGARSDAAYRTNVGFVNLGSETSSVRVTLLDKQSGQVSGTWERDFAPGESAIASNLIRALHQTADRGSLRIEVLSGSPIWAYGSVIDQLTSDPEYVPAVPLD
ncbi:MAG TPA: hypothetical protein VMS56_04275, partial [Thermoanaerobaculia bacterium]|nr:hypothetical protein [Thermoanaerobaculia bacterium]